MRGCSGGACSLGTPKSRPLGSRQAAALPHQFAAKRLPLSGRGRRLSAAHRQLSAQSSTAPEAPPPQPPPLKAALGGGLLLGALLFLAPLAARARPAVGAPSAAAPVAHCLGGEAAARARSGAFASSSGREQRDAPWPRRSAEGFASVSVSTQATAAVYQRTRTRDVLAFKLAQSLQRLLGAHVVVKIVGLIFIGAPIIWLGGAIHSVITGSPLQVSVFKVYSVVLRAPGARVTEETSVPAALLINSFFLIGIFTLAVLIGVVSEEIKSQLAGVRYGNLPVMAADHTLILNWNRQAEPLLRKMAANRHGCLRSLGRNVVVLAERGRDELEREVARVVGGSALNVVTREGAPHFVRDLEAVSAAKARTVIILHPENDKYAEFHKAATILGLETARRHPSTTYAQQRIVLQSPDDPSAADAAAAAALGELAREEGGREAAACQETVMSVVKASVRGRSMRVVDVNGNRNIARLIAQSAVQPGVAGIYSAIAQSFPGAPDFQVVDCQALAGKTFKEARRAFPDGVVTGYIRGDRRTHLNPPDSTVLDFADRLVVLSHSREPRPVLEAGGPAGAPDMEALARQLQEATPPFRPPKSVVVIGWEGDLGDLASGIEDFAPAGTEVTVVTAELPEEAPRLGGRCSLRFVVGGTQDRDTYRRAGVASCHSVILGSLDSPNTKAADARMLTSLLVVQDMLKGVSGPPPHVVACLNHYESLQTANHILSDSQLGKGRITAELLQPDELVSGMLLQVAHEPALSAALSQLIDGTRGTRAEIYLRRPELYGLSPARRWTFAELSELARLRGETCLGYVAADRSLVLAPDAGDMYMYDRDSRIIVISE